MPHTKAEKAAPEKKSPAKKAAAAKAPKRVGTDEWLKGPVISRLVRYHAKSKDIRVSEKARAAIRDLGNGALEKLGGQVSNALGTKKVVVKHDVIEMIAKNHGLKLPSKDVLANTEVVKGKDAVGVHTSANISCIATATFKRAAKMAIGQLASGKKPELGDEGLYAMRALLERSVADVIHLASMFTEQAGRKTMSSSDVTTAVSAVCNSLIR